MSAWAWIECPKGCKVDKDNHMTVRVDMDWNFDENSAYVMMNFECQVCGLKCRLEQTKKPKKVITEMVFD